MTVACSGEGATVENYVHKVDKAPSFQFEIPKFMHWEIKRLSDTIIRFTPDETILTLFETAPNISILIDRKLEKNQVKETSEVLKTERGIPYRQVFVSGFAKKGLKFTKDQHEIIILMVDHIPEHGLDAQVVEKNLLRTFKYLSTN